MTLSDDAPEPRFKPIHLLFIAMACMGLSSAIFESTLNPYLKDVFELAADARGKLEFPRELPGFLCSIFAGVLFFLPETRMAAVAAAVMAVGLFGLAQVDMGYGHMIVWLFLWSAGTHLLMPLRASLTIHLSAPGRSGTRLGQVAFVRSLGTVVGSLLVWQVLGRLDQVYRVSFLCAGGAGIVAALVFMAMPKGEQHKTRLTRFVFKERYTVYYLLCVLFGARKQVFLTFGTWVLVREFEQGPDAIAKLWLAASLTGLVTNPLLGRVIDWLGERTVLVVDGLVLVAICLGYGFAEKLLPRDTALVLLQVCYVVDLLMFSVGMARQTYVGKIAETKDDVTPTLSLGVTIDHAVSMTVPWLGGMLWMACGYPSVFMAAAVVALMTAATACFVRVPEGAAGGEEG